MRQKQQSLDFFYRGAAAKKVHSTSKDRSEEADLAEKKDATNGSEVEVEVPAPKFKRLKKNPPEPAAKETTADAEADVVVLKEKEEDEGEKVKREGKKTSKASSISLQATEKSSKGKETKQVGIQLGKDTSVSAKKTVAKSSKVTGVGLKSLAAAEKHKTYDSKENANWDSGKAIPYKFLADAFDKIAKDSKRLVKTQILTETLRTVISTSPEDLLPLIYLTVNRLAPAHEGVELGIGDATIIKALAESTGRKENAINSEYKECGCLGMVAQNSRSNQRTLFQPKPLFIRQVFAAFREIALTEGGKSSEKKRNVIKKLLTSSKNNEASYVTRALQSKLRIGLAEKTILTSLAQAIMLEKGEVEEDRLAESLEEGATIVKQVYSQCPSYDEMIPALLEFGVLDLTKHCKFTVGVPVSPMLAKPTKGIAEVLQKLEDAEFTCEFKYDGERAQIHYDGDKTKIFSRNSEDNTGKYPDIIIDTIPQILKGTTTNVVLDGEVVAYDKEKREILPFQRLQTRKRKEVSSEDIKVQVCYFAFDCLHYNGKSLLQAPLSERRAALQEACQEVEGKFYFAKGRTSRNVEDLEEFLEESIEAKTEGLMVKTLESTYEPSQRSNNWLKLKKDYMEGNGTSDSVDLVVVGAWKGKGKRVGKYGAYLLACYNDDTEEFETIGKIGTGFKDEDLESCFKQLNEHTIECPRPYYKWNSEKNVPDVWFDASVVWEVKAADLTISPVYKAAIGLVDEEKGISLRFPRYLRTREDKTPTSCTNSQQIHDLYLQQGQSKAKKADDEFSGSDDE